jgi:hypothetical protein
MMITKRDLAILVTRLLALILIANAADFLFGPIVPSVIAALLNAGNLADDLHRAGMGITSPLIITLIYPLIAIAAGLVLLRFSGAVQRFLVPTLEPRSQKLETRN